MEDFVILSSSRSCSSNDINNLLGICIEKQYNSKEFDQRNLIIEENVRILFEQDFKCEIIPNENGQLCSSYPSKVLIPKNNKWSKDEQFPIGSSNQISDLFNRSRIARCRSRFIVPVILINGKYICRSSTLSSWGEIYPRSTIDRFQGSETRSSSIVSFPTSDNDQTLNSFEEDGQRSLFDKVRGSDIDLLRFFNIDTILNLMVQKKNSFFGLNITASEMFDKFNRYQRFNHLLLPYPGCEHFKDLITLESDEQFFFYDWTLSKNDAIIQIPSHFSSLVNTDWSFWKSWNSIDLTKNYFQFLIRLLEKDPNGILIHCLSGWDRTPLFICLLRLSLWADGLIHQSLTTEEILYLTLAYDWFLFGHQLPLRLKNNEQILHFTFILLPHLIEQQFLFKPTNQFNQNSISNHFYPNISQESILFDQENLSHSIENEILKIRKEKLLSVYHLFKKFYENLFNDYSTNLHSQSQRLNLTRPIKKFFSQQRSKFQSSFK